MINDFGWVRHHFQKEKEEINRWDYPCKVRLGTHYFKLYNFNYHSILYWTHDNINFNPLGVNNSEFVIKWSQLGRNEFFHNVRGKVGPYTEF